MKSPLSDPNRKRRITQTADWGLFLVLALALCGIANYFAYKYHARWDITASRSFSISPQTKKVLKDLKKPLNVVVFLSPADEIQPRVKDLLAAYQQASPMVKVEYVDPDRQRDRAQVLAKKYGVSRANLVVFDTEDRSKFVEKDQMVEYDFSAMQMGGGATVKGFKAEEAFTNAVLDVMNPEKPVVYFTTGHGERSGDSQGGEGIATLRSRLQGEGMVLKEWQSLGQPAAPEDASLIVIPGPQKPFDAHEAEALGAYLQKGGRALFLLDPILSEGKKAAFQKTGLEEVLSQWGACPRQDLVVDPKMAVPYVGAQTFFAGSYGVHPIVSDLRKNRFPVVFTLACSIQTGKAPEGYTVEPLLSTSDGAWGETDLAQLDAVKKDERDTAGPMALAAVVGSAQKEKKARLVVAGDSELASDSLLQTGAGNALFALNAVHWLLSQEQRIAIPPKTAIETRLTLTSSQAWSLVILFVVILPGLVVGAGIRAYLLRRR
jgi:ABC-2 type transport system permease protein